MKTWKKYVGYDQWDQSSAGQQTYFPGPLDTTNLFTGEWVTRRLAGWGVNWVVRGKVKCCVLHIFCFVSCAVLA